MARQDIEGMIWIGGRWWWFPARIDTDSEFEWHEGKLYLLEQSQELVLPNARRSTRIGDSSVANDDVVHFNALQSVAVRFPRAGR